MPKPKKEKTFSPDLYHFQGEKLPKLFYNATLNLHTESETNDIIFTVVVFKWLEGGNLAQEDPLLRVEENFFLFFSFVIS